MNQVFPFKIVHKSPLEIFIKIEMQFVVFGVGVEWKPQGGGMGWVWSKGLAKIYVLSWVYSPKEPEFGDVRN